MLNHIHLFRIIGLAAFVVFSLAGPSFGQAPSRQAQVRAAFVFNFIKFVEWPDSTWTDDKAPLKLCIWGGKSVNGALAALGGKTAQRRSIQVLYIQKAQQSTGCHVLFVTGTDRGALRRLIRQTAGKHLLTVGDVEGFAGSGGVIGLFLANDRMRFAINVGAARAAGLRISSQLLKLGKIVSTDERQP